MVGNRKWHDLEREEEEGDIKDVLSYITRPRRTSTAHSVEAFIVAFYCTYNTHMGS